MRLDRKHSLTNCVKCLCPFSVQVQMISHYIPQYMENYLMSNRKGKQCVNTQGYDINGTPRGNFKRELAYSECLLQVDHTILFSPQDRPKRKAALSLDVETGSWICQNLVCLIPNFMLFWLLHFDSTLLGTKDRRKQFKLAQEHAISNLENQ